MEKSITPLLTQILDSFSGALLGLALGLSTAAFFNYQKSRRMYLKGQQHYEEGLEFHKYAQQHYNEAKAELRFWKEQTDQLMKSRELNKRLN